MIINTGKLDIPDEPKIPAHMGIINNGAESRNSITDPFNEYDGFIGIELRGTSSLNWPKKSYGIETRDAEGENNNVSILGMDDKIEWKASGTKIKIMPPDDIPGENAWVFKIEFQPIKP